MEKEVIKNRAIGFLILLLIFIALESKDRIEPRQYHVVENNYPLPIDFSVSTIISGTAASSATIYPGPITFNPFDEKDLG
jgi:hypothetical protein